MGTRKEQMDHAARGRGLKKAAALKARVRNAVRWPNERAGENGRGGKAASAEGAHRARTPRGREPPSKMQVPTLFCCQSPRLGVGPLYNVAVRRVGAARGARVPTPPLHLKYYYITP